jgi:hypothetical protein
MIEAVNFKPEHMVNIEKADIDADIVSFLGDVDSRAETYAQEGPAITLLDGDIVLAIGGVIQFWPRVGEAWMMVSPPGRIKKLFLYKHMDSFVQLCFDQYGFHRIQASVLYHHKEAHKCIMRLNFIPEGMMVHYGVNKENYVRYVRLRA